MDRKQFIEKLAPFAMEAMRKTGIPASLTIAQGCLESSNGNSGLTKKYNNLFGMKGTGDAGQTEPLQTTEYWGGKAHKVMAQFAAFSGWQACVDARCRLLLNGVSWDRSKYRKVVGADWRTAAKEIAAAGYATDPAYEKLVLDIMLAYKLWQYDDKAKGEEPMTAEERRQFDAMASVITQQAQHIAALEKTLQPIDAPDWARRAFEYFQGPTWTTKQLTFEGWRLLVIQYRKETGDLK